MWIKVCGMGDPENIQQVAALKPDLMGFIFYAGSPRYAGQLDPEAVKQIAADIRKVGVFVNEDAIKVEEIARRYDLTFLQLHGHESPEQCRHLREKGFKIIKTVGIKERMDTEVCRVYKACCDFFLFDTADTCYGGTGRKFNWEILQEYRESIPFLLSGGISAANTEEIKTLKHPAFIGVDVNSRFEVSPGQKEVRMLRDFIEKCRRVF